MILVIDNYDSFTYNLVHYIGEFDKIIDKMFLKYKKNKNKIKLITIGAGDVNQIGYRLKNLIKESK